MVLKLIALLFLLCTPLLQQANRDALAPYYISDLNQIENDKTLMAFFQKLDSLVIKRQGKVSVLHIGDSHIQADVMTGQMRLRMQNTFGNGGRGFVFPYQIARSNGPLDVKIDFDGHWTSRSIMKQYQGLDIGASGYTTQAEDSAMLFVKADNDLLIHSFNKLTLFQSGGHLIPDQKIDSKAVAFGGSKSFPFATYLFNEYQDSIALRVQSKDSQLVNFEGMSLENTEPGLLYHAMGTNGSSTLQYLRSNSFEKQMAALSADLVIISFGTNDCYLPRSRFCTSCTKDRFRQLIRRIKKQNPEAAILITTPANHYYRRRYDNLNLLNLNRSLRKLAYEENCGLWDLYHIMGGKRSIVKWRDAGLARRDLIHFSKQGYILQADLLYEAIMRSYDGRYN